MTGLVPHTPEWYDRLAQLQKGYYYPWKSVVGQPNGEQAFLELVKSHLNQDSTVLEIGCGHGELALALAPLCNKVLAYDRIPSYIEMAHTLANQRQVSNVSFILADSSAEANQGAVNIPAQPHSFDLVISRRGPLHWIEDVRRVARPGAVLIQLNPLHTPLPKWNEQLPEILQLKPRSNYPIRSSVERRLALVGLEIESCWSFEVLELFEEPYQLYLYLSWGQSVEERPSYQEVEKTFKQIFEKYGTPKGVALRFGRFLWKAVLD